MLPSFVAKHMCQAFHDCGGVPEAPKQRRNQPRQSPGGERAETHGLTRPLPDLPFKTIPGADGVLIFVSRRQSHVIPHPAADNGPVQERSGEREEMVFDCKHRPRKGIVFVSGGGGGKSRGAHDVPPQASETVPFHHIIIIISPRLRTPIDLQQSWPVSGIHRPPNTSPCSQGHSTGPPCYLQPFRIAANSHLLDTSLTNQAIKPNLAAKSTSHSCRPSQDNHDQPRIKFRVPALVKAGLSRTLSRDVIPGAAITRCSY